jgi:hypothetical protein
MGMADHGFDGTYGEAVSMITEDLLEHQGLHFVINGGRRAMAFT